MLLKCVFLRAYFYLFILLQSIVLLLYLATTSAWILKKTETMIKEWLFQLGRANPGQWGWGKESEVRKLETVCSTLLPGYHLRRCLQETEQTTMAHRISLNGLQGQSVAWSSLWEEGRGRRGIYLSSSLLSCLSHWLKFTHGELELMPTLPGGIIQFILWSLGHWLPEPHFPQGNRKRAAQ